MTWWNYSTILIDFCYCHNTCIITPHTILFHLSLLSPLSFFFSFFISFLKFILFFQYILSLHFFSLLFSLSVSLLSPFFSVTLFPSFSSVTVSETPFLTHFRPSISSINSHLTEHQIPNTKNQILKTKTWTLIPNISMNKNTPHQLWPNNLGRKTLFVR